MKKVRVGFVGSGGIAERHIQALAHLPGVTIGGITSPSRPKAQALAARCGPDTAVFGNYRDLLEKAALDALYICVPPFAHGEIELAAIEKDLPFLVEKPLAAGSEVPEKILSAVQAKKLVTAVGYQWRYLDTTDMARDRLKNHPAHLALGFWLDKLPPPAWWAEQDLSGGQVVEQTTHIIDLARYLVGEITEVFALAARTSTPSNHSPGVDTVSVVSVKFKGGAVGNFSSTSILNRLFKKGLTLFSEGLTLEMGYQDLILDEGQGNPPKITAQADPFVLENQDFLEAVTGGPNRIRTDYQEAVLTHRVTQATQLSIKENRPVII